LIFTAMVTAAHLVGPPSPATSRRVRCGPPL
jgi:hypothetical protein